MDEIEKIIDQVLSTTTSKADPELTKRYREDVLAVVEKTHRDKSQHYVVTRNDDKVAIGYIGFRSCIKDLLPFTFTDKPLEVNALYIEENEQGKGIGNMLVQYIRYMAEQKRYTEIILRSGQRFKDTSWGFYEKIGFERVGDTRDPEGEDYGIFRLKL